MSRQVVEEAQAEAAMLERHTVSGERLGVQPTMLLAASCFLWAGMILGISFLETPVKFTAPSVTLPIGLDVGRHVFGMFNKVEIIWALLVYGLMHAARGSWLSRLPLMMVVGVVLLQTVWLLPVLDERVGMVLSGQTPPPAPYHLVYVMLEVLKLICLMTTGTACLRVLTSSANTTQQRTQK